MKEALSAVERASGENLNLPVLKYARLEAHESQVELTATNLEIEITCFVSGKVIEKGKVSVPISTFLNLINNGHPKETTTPKQ